MIYFSTSCMYIYIYIELGFHLIFCFHRFGKALCLAKLIQRPVVLTGEKCWAKNLTLRLLAWVKPLGGFPGQFQRHR